MYISEHTDRHPKYGGIIAFFLILGVVAIFSGIVYTVNYISRVSTDTRSRASESQNAGGENFDDSKNLSQEDAPDPFPLLIPQATLDSVKKKQAAVNVKNNSNILGASVASEVDECTTDCATTADGTKVAFDRPDDQPGRQIHVVYLLTSDPTTSPGRYRAILPHIQSMVTLGMNGLYRAVGDRLRFDTYDNGKIDVTFMKIRQTSQEVNDKVNAIGGENGLRWIFNKASTQVRSGHLNSADKTYVFIYDGAGFGNCGAVQLGGDILIALRGNQSGNICEDLFLSKNQAGLIQGPKPLLPLFTIRGILATRGIVQGCAPHSTAHNNTDRNAHAPWAVTDSDIAANKIDIMDATDFSGANTLDVNGDDYYKKDGDKYLPNNQTPPIPRCPYNFAKSYLWEKNTGIAPNPFKDITTASEKRIVDWIYHWGIMTGFSPSDLDRPDVYKFKPNVKISRQGISTKLWRMASSPDYNVPVTTAPFSDVAIDSRYAKGIRWVKQHNVMVGAQDNKFKPQDLVPHKQMLLILYRMAGSPALPADTPELTASRAANLTPDQKTAVRWALKWEIISLRQTMQLNKDITRLELAQYLKKVASKPLSQDTDTLIKLTNYVVPISDEAGPGEQCGGIRGIMCVAGYHCNSAANTPDASGTCVSDAVPTVTPTPTLPAFVTKNLPCYSFEIPANNTFTLFNYPNNDHCEGLLRYRPEVGAEGTVQILLDSRPRDQVALSVRNGWVASGHEITNENAFSLAGVEAVKFVSTKKVNGHITEQHLNVFSYLKSPINLTDGTTAESVQITLLYTGVRQKTIADRVISTWQWK